MHFSERKRYPWRLGATSFVLPATVEDNVEFLAGKVDDIQLLFFESAWKAKLPNDIDLPRLAGLALEHGHSYTLHLPLDLQLGSAENELRQRGVDEICRLVDLCQDLTPMAYDLHLNRELDLPEDQWLDNVLQSLGDVKKRLGEEWQKVAVENIEYDFRSIDGLLIRCQGRVCADFGHLHHQQFPDHNWFTTYDVNHVHLHGVSDGRDHQPLTPADIPFLQRLAAEMVAYDYGNVVTLELYKVEALAASFAVIDQAWREFSLDTNIK